MQLLAGNPHPLQEGFDQGHCRLQRVGGSRPAQQLFGKHWAVRQTSFPRRIRHPLARSRRYRPVHSGHRHDASGLEELEETCKSVGECEAHECRWSSLLPARPAESRPFKEVRTLIQYTKNYHRILACRSRSMKSGLGCAAPKTSTSSLVFVALWSGSLLPLTITETAGAATHRA